MKQINLIPNFLVAGMLFLSTSCSDFLEEYSQDKAQIETWEDLDELLLGDGHLEPCLFANSSADEVHNNLDILHFMSDELKESTANESSDDLLAYRTNQFAFFTWQQDTGVDDKQNYVGGDEIYWNMLYEKINTCNMVLALIDEQSATDEEDVYGKERVKGEAHFLRAAYYFLLANLYAQPYDPQTASSSPCVPIKLTEYVEDKEYRRESLSAVYAQVLDDLDQAEICLQGKERVSVYHPDLTATYLLRSRVYLYMQNWQAAAEDASRVLARQNGLLDLHTLPEGQDAVYRDSPETIFSMGGYLIAVAFADYETWLGFSYNTSWLISDDMMALFKHDDLRTERYIGETENFHQQPVLKKVNGQESAWGGYDEVSDCFLLRTPEAYFTLAEASVYLNDETTARQTLEDFLATRMETPITVTESGNELIDFIREERAREFLLEGHRWFDLRRYTVCQPYPWSKSIEHYHVYFDGVDPLYSDWYRLEPNDAAYTLPIPRAIREFQISIGNNIRPVRQPFKTENY